MKTALIAIIALCLMPALGMAQPVEDKIAQTLGNKHSLVKKWLIIADSEAGWASFLEHNPACQQSRTACSNRESRETHIRASYVAHAEPKELLHVLLHEAAHLSGRLDEAGAEWWAYQHEN